MKTSSFLPVVLLIAVGLIISCKESEDEKALTDQEIIEEISESGYIYYSTDTLSGMGAHVPFLMVRFNPTAQGVLNQDNKIEPGQSFPEGSIIVKEMFSAKGGNLLRQYVMMKKPNDPNAALNWIWSTYSANNTVEFSVNRKGVGCFECHSIPPHRDGVKLFDIH